MSLKQNDHYNETVDEAQEPLTRTMANAVNQINKIIGADKRKPLREDQHYCKCGAKIPLKHEMCFKCYSEQPARITQFNK